MGASTYSSQSIIETEYFNLQHAQDYSPSTNELPVAQTYLPSFNYIHSLPQLLTTCDHTISYSIEETSQDYTKNIALIQSKLDSMVAAYHHFTTAIEGMLQLLQICRNSAIYRKEKENKGKFVIWPGNKEQQSIESIPFNFIECKYGIYECASVVSASFLFEDYLTQNKVQLDCEYILQHKSNEVDNKKEDTQLLHTAIKSGIIKSLFAKQHKNITNLYASLCRLECVMCITVHNNFYTNEIEVANMLGGIAAIVKICDHYSKGATYDEFHMFPMPLVINTLLSLSSNNSQYICSGCVRALKQIQSCQAMLTLIDAKMKELIINICK